MSGSRKAAVFAMILIALASLQAHADYDPGMEYSAMIGTVNTAIGSNTPQAVVEQFSGAFSTSYSIDVPPGRRNIQPDLKLSYNSRAGSSWVGLGWSLALASMNRKINHGKPAYDDTDVFQFSGQDLVLIDGATYRLKHESSFMTFRRDDTYNRWIATDLNGTKYYFGKVLSNEVGTSIEIRTGTNTSGFNGTFQWYLVGVADVFSNYMTIEYQTSGALGYYYPSSMKYTGNDDQSTSPYYEVVFNLSARDDITPSYLAGFTIEVNKKLSTIQIKANNSVIRTYSFTQSYSSSSGRLLLSSIQVSAPGETVLPATYFNYISVSQGQGGWDETNPAPWHLPRAIGYYNQTTVYDFGTRLADLNGDGLVDLVEIIKHPGASGSKEVYVYKNTGDHDSPWEEKTSWEDAINDLDDGSTLIAFVRYYSGWQSLPLRIFDINGDGLADFVWSHGLSGSTVVSHVYLNASYGDTLVFEEPNESGWTDPLLPFDNSSGNDVGTNVGDINGDGLPDLVQLQYGPTNRHFYLNNGDGTWYEDTTYRQNFIDNVDKYLAPLENLWLLFDSV